MNLVDKNLPFPQKGDFALFDDVFKCWDGNQWCYLQNPGEPIYTVNDIISIFERDPDLYNDVMVEMRKRKIDKILK